MRHAEQIELRSPFVYANRLFCYTCPSIPSILLTNMNTQSYPKNISPFSTRNCLLFGFFSIFSLVQIASVKIYAPFPLMKNLYEFGNTSAIEPHIKRLKDDSN